MKDNFSTKSADYAKFRPVYPQEVYDFIEKQLPQKQKAWDCGTGNGQVAAELAKFFEKVSATDISEQQLSHAPKMPNIDYSGQPAESTNFPDDHFDLVTVAQAIHWFKFNEFYKEVKRVLKPGAIIAIFGYGLFKSNPETNKVIDHFYRNIIGEYWDPERRYLDEEYKTIPFPFKEIKTPKISLQLHWSYDQLIGYLKTWSAVKHYEKANGRNPVDLIAEDLKQAFGENGEITYPILFRMGKFQ
ncbi:methyltransferase domain-containing protein [Zunongwangia sp. F260]|uniref:Methyltransferase domain-containing protein n=1 Tax=Autumnicola lenta TaxID=3075593 RepID=A0ABU3CK17_9FLAO|nr:methyltransferase domain-containing protein [Zunongwangia sp. F260]MDT0646572.1 methyltransferase domain-containing protein [Zunongwangia sp. F260]